jgi:hypothetical protein
MSLFRRGNSNITFGVQSKHQGSGPIFMGGGGGGELRDSSLCWYYQELELAWQTASHPVRRFGDGVTSLISHISSGRSSGSFPLPRIYFVDKSTSGSSPLKRYFCETQIWQLSFTEILFYCKTQIWQLCVAEILSCLSNTEITALFYRFCLVCETQIWQLSFTKNLFCW